MDTGYSYREECSKAEEIQKQRRLFRKTVWNTRIEPKEYGWETEDFYVLPDSSEVMIFRNDCEECYERPTNDAIWLPKQDQLQKMLGIKDAWDLMFYFREFSFEYKIKFPNWALYTNPDCGISMERLWLRFVMKDVYGKIWAYADKSYKDSWVEESKYLKFIEKEHGRKWDGYTWSEPHR